MTKLHELYDVGGQSPWLDNLKRSYLTSGRLAELVSSGVRGLLYARKHRGDISWEPAVFRQGLKRDLPIRWRRNQTPRQIVCSSSLKRQTQGVQDPLFIQFSRS